jgi:hypothetical protein
MKCKKIFQLLSIFVLTLPFQAQTQTFSSHDLERLINQHPMMKNYDPATKRFKNTPSAIQPIAKIKAEIASITSLIKTLENNRQQILTTTLQNDSESPDEFATWKQLTEKDEQIQAHKRRRAELQELEMTNGAPPISRVLDIAREIMFDSYLLLKKQSKSSIKLNNLPRFYQPPPSLTPNPFTDFFMNPKDKKKLAAYLSKKNTIFLLFPTLCQPVLINERNSGQ